MEFKLPIRLENSNKSSFGKVLNIAGSANYTGAAYLSSISALRSGCGYVTLASVPQVLKSVSYKTPDIVLLPINKVKNVVEDYNVISIGCGFSMEPTAVLMFKSLFAVISEHSIPVVVDADGLNILSKFRHLSPPKRFVITPHPKEASRLLKVSVEEILENPEKYAKQLSEKYSAVTVLKMHKTIVCSKNLQIYVNDTGNSALSKAGSGDVLCGMISGFIAQGMTSFEAAKLAVYLHGRAGELASVDLTEYCMLASDLINYIPLAIRELAQNS